MIMNKLLSLFVVLSFFVSCSGDDPNVIKDETKPVIADGDMPSPISCEVYKKGETIPVRYTFSDNVELGNFNLEIHNNFSHHSHDTSKETCNLDPIKTAVHPFVYSKDFSIPSGSKTYAAKVDIPIPTDIDSGDYHFMIRLTDSAGWQELKAVSIKIVDAGS